MYTLDFFQSAVFNQKLQTSTCWELKKSTPWHQQRSKRRTNSSYHICRSESSSSYRCRKDILESKTFLKSWWKNLWFFFQVGINCFFCTVVSIQKYTVCVVEYPRSLKHIHDPLHGSFLLKSLNLQSRLANPLCDVKWTFIKCRKAGMIDRGTPKWMVYNGKPYWNGWFGDTPIFGNTHSKFKTPSPCCHVNLCRRVSTISRKIVLKALNGSVNYIWLTGEITQHTVIHNGRISNYDHWTHETKRQDPYDVYVLDVSSLPVSHACAKTTSPQSKQPWQPWEASKDPSTINSKVQCRRTYDSANTQTSSTRISAARLNLCRVFSVLTSFASCLTGNWLNTQTSKHPSQMLRLVHLYTFKSSPAPHMFLSHFVFPLSNTRASERHNLGDGCGDGMPRHGTTRGWLQPRCKTNIPVELPLERASPGFWKTANMGVFLCNTHFYREKYRCPNDSKIQMWQAFIYLYTFSMKSQQVNRSTRAGSILVSKKNTHLLGIKTTHLSCTLRE